MGTGDLGGGSAAYFLDKASARTFFNPGRYIIMKLKREKNKDHRACLEFKRFAWRSILGSGDLSGP